MILSRLSGLTLKISFVHLDVADYLFGLGSKSCKENKKQNDPNILTVSAVSEEPSESRIQVRKTF